MTAPTGRPVRSGSPFDALADDYDRARPRYPGALFDALPPLAGRDLLELGAGTGIATRRLVARGARVVALDLGPSMLARLLARSPGTPVVLADAQALPVRAGAVDLVCAAQAWHWVRVTEAAAEVVRVLRPGGRLCVWWNEVAAEHEPWWQAQQDRLEAGSPGYSRHYRDRRPYGEELLATGLFGRVDGPVEVPWTRTLDLDTYAAWLRSKSYVAAMGAGLPGFLTAERASLSAAFPDGLVREPFVTRLWTATRGETGA